MHFVNGTRRPVTHILQVENTRSGAPSPTCGVLYEKKKKKKSTGSSIYFTFHILRLRGRYGRDFWASGRAIPSGYQLSMRFSRDIWSSSLENVPRGRLVEGSAAFKGSCDCIARRNYVFMIARLLFALTTNDFYAISMESTVDNLILFNGKSCVTQF